MKVICTHCNKVLDFRGKSVRALKRLACTGCGALTLRLARLKAVGPCIGGVGYRGKWAAADAASGVQASPGPDLVRDRKSAAAGERDDDEDETPLPAMTAGSGFSDEEIQALYSDLGGEG
jgi:hypothetical protein